MLEVWKRDYKRMLEEMIYEENALTFEHLAISLRQLKEKLASLEWGFKLEFPH